jgi:hypothetical protein
MGIRDDMTCKRTDAKRLREAFLTISLGAALVCVPARNANAQAPAGPIAPPQASDAPTAERPVAQPAPRPVRKPIGGHPNLAGLWTMNRDDSDDPGQKIRSANEESGNNGNPRHGGWGGPGGGGPFGYPGGGGGGPYGGNPGGGVSRGQDQADQAAEDAAADVVRLTIEQTSSTAVVTSSSGKTLANYSAPDNSSSSNTTSDPSSAGTNSGTNSTSKSSAKAPTESAEWQGSQFVTVTQETTGAKTKTTRTYELSSDGSQLNVTTKLEGSHFKRPVTYLLVYDLTDVE